MEVCQQKNVDVLPPYKKKQRKSIARKKYLSTWLSVRCIVFFLCSYHVGKSYNKYCEPEVPSRIIESSIYKEESGRKLLKNKRGRTELSQRPLYFEKLVNYC